MPAAARPGFVVRPGARLERTARKGVINLIFVAITAAADAPARGVDAPTRTDDAPTRGVDGQTMTADAPTRGDDAPTMTDDAPTKGDDAPTDTADGPASADRPSFTAEDAEIAEASQECRKPKGQSSKRQRGSNPRPPVPFRCVNAKAAKTAKERQFTAGVES